jgi:PTH1 family peptidyl-tRNA hydrolase
MNLFHIQPDNDNAQQSGIFLIAGLGNPGRMYRLNRHNVGFMLIDHLAESAGIKLGKVQSRAITGLGDWESKRLLLVKPQTYMNLSGDAIFSLLKYYKIPKEQLMVVHDDLDLPLGTIRIRPSGGAGGQKGMASIIKRLDTQNFSRMRIGIGRPPGQMQASDYVLEDFLTGEREVLEEVLKRASEAIRVFISSSVDQAMTQFNSLPKKD